MLLRMGDDPRQSRWSAPPGFQFLLIQVRLDKTEFIFDAASSTVIMASGVEVNPFGAVFMGGEVNGEPVVAATFNAGARFEPPRIPNQFGSVAVVPTGDVPRFLCTNEKVYRLAPLGQPVPLLPQYENMSFLTDISFHSDLVDADRVGALDGWDVYDVPIGKPGLLAKRKMEDQFYAVFRISHALFRESATLETTSIVGKGRSGRTHAVKGLLVWVGSNGLPPHMQGNQSLAGRFGMGPAGLRTLFGGLNFAPRNSYVGPYTTAGLKSSKLVLELDSSAFEDIIDVDVTTGFVLKPLS